MEKGNARSEGFPLACEQGHGRQEGVWECQPKPSVCGNAITKPATLHAKIKNFKYA